MKYLCLGYYDAEKFDIVSAAEQEAIASECRPHDEALRASGHLVAVASLQHRVAATLRPRNGKPSRTDGPFVETKEVIGGYWMIQVNSKEEAIEWATRCPGSENEIIELRQVQEFSDFPDDVKETMAGFSEMQGQGRQGEGS
jgi:hypothetical protein